MRVYRRRPCRSENSNVHLIYLLVSFWLVRLFVCLRQDSSLAGVSGATLSRGAQASVAWILLLLWSAGARALPEL